MGRGPGARWCVVIFGVLASLGLSCTRDPPSVVVNLSLATEQLNGLSRLRIIARECDVTQIALLQDVTLTSPPSARVPLEAAVQPGNAFYVWVQGWGPCSPANAPCVTADEARPGECTCFEDRTDFEPKHQVWKQEDCSTWLRAAGDDTTVALRLEPQGRKSCPPPLSTTCDAVAR